MKSYYQKMSHLYSKRFKTEIYDAKMGQNYNSLFLITTNTKGVVLSVNSRFLQFTGYDINDCVGKNCNFLQNKNDTRNYDGNWKTRYHINQKLTIPFYVTFFNKTKTNYNYVIYLKIEPIVKNDVIIGYYSLGKPMRELLTIYKIHMCKKELEEKGKAWRNKRHIPLEFI